MKIKILFQVLATLSQENVIVRTTPREINASGAKTLTTETLGLGGNVIISAKPEEC